MRLCLGLGVCLRYRSLVEPSILLTHRYLPPAVVPPLYPALRFSTTGLSIRPLPKRRRQEASTLLLTAQPTWQAYAHFKEHDEETYRFDSPRHNADPSAKRARFYQGRGKNIFRSERDQFGQRNHRVDRRELQFGIQRLE